MSDPTTPERDAIGDVEAIGSNLALYCMRRGLGMGPAKRRRIAIALALDAIDELGEVIRKQLSGLSDKEIGP